MPQMSNLWWMPIMIFTSIALITMKTIIFPTYLTYYNKNQYKFKMSKSESWMW